MTPEAIPATGGPGLTILLALLAYVFFAGITAAIVRGWFDDADGDAIGLSGAVWPISLFVLLGVAVYRFVLWTVKR